MTWKTYKTGLKGLIVNIVSNLIFGFLLGLSFGLFNYEYIHLIVVVVLFLSYPLLHGNILNRIFKLK